MHATSQIIQIGIDKSIAHIDGLLEKIHPSHFSIFFGLQDIGHTVFIQVYEFRFIRKILLRTRNHSQLSQMQKPNIPHRSCLHNVYLGLIHQ